MMDALTRRARMQGFDVLWLPGMDHASIAVQNLVERYLAETEGKGRFDYTREQFIEKAWEWKERYGGRILDQMRRLGDGVDWTRERFTMDAGLSRAVQTIFKQLYDDGLIYRAERIINWCPRDLTALSDIEVDHVGRAGRAGLDPVRRPGRRRRADRRRHNSRRDDVGRHRGRSASRRRSVPPPGRKHRRPAAHQPAHPDRRRRARRPELRHRRGEGHARARPERLRDRSAPRPADAHDHG